MKVLVVGAGGQGGPCVSILAKDTEVEEVRLGDISLDAANTVKAKVASDKVIVEKIDAGNSKSIAKAAAGADLVMDLVTPEFSKNVMEGALGAGAHYVNTAFHEPFWSELIQGKPLSLDEEFKKAGLTAVLGCGMAPGFLNVITRLYTDKMDVVNSIKLRLAKKKLGVQEMIEPWNPGWSPRQALLDCADAAFSFEEGEMKVNPPYSGLESYAFPEPLGETLVSHHCHEEPLTMPRFIGKGLQYCDFKYYVSPQPAAFVTAGLASEEEVLVDGVKVKPLSLLTKLLPKPGSAFLEEDSSKYEYLDETSFVCMMVEVEGEKDGSPVRYKVHLPKLTASGGELCKLFGTSLINVALPAVIGGKMAVRGIKKGIISSECLDPQEFLKLFLDSGIPYKWYEMDF